MKNALRFHGFHGRSPGNKEGEFINLMLILRHTTQLPMLARAITQLRTIFLLLLILGQGGIKCGNRGTGFLDSEGSHR